MNDNPDRERCYFCGEGHAEALEEHHIVPRRLNGSDEPENTVWLCGSCHDKIERMYDDEFYDRLNVAVDELQREPLERTTAGIEVEPNNSKSREIPADSPHIKFERWHQKVTIAEIEENRFEGHMADFVSGHKERILERYRQEEQSATELEDMMKEHDDTLPQWVKDEGDTPVLFEYQHNELDKVPSLIVQNKERDRIDRETEYKMDSDEESSSDSYEYLLPEKRRAARITARVNSENAAVPDLADSYPPVYRLHCSYCHTAFSMHQHADMARHLRLRHGIEDPYERQDTAYSEAIDPSNLFNNDKP